MNIPAPYTSVDVDFTNTPTMSLVLNSASGYTVLKYGPNYPGPGNATNATPSGLVSGNTYTATVTIDGSPILVSITGASALTMSTFLSALQSAIGAAGTVTMDYNGYLTITSATSGPNSIVTVLDTGAYPLFGSVKGVSTLMLGTIVPGSGYTPGSYTNVPLTGGRGTGATANITVTGSVVTAVVVVNQGFGYTNGDVLSAASANIGGTGSGFSVPVSGISFYAFGEQPEATVVVNGGTFYNVWKDLDGVVQSNVATVVNQFLAAAPANTNTSWSDGFEAITVPATLTASSETSLVYTTTYQLGVNVDGAGAVQLFIPLQILETPQTPVSYSHLVEAMNIAMGAAGMNATTTFVPGATGQIVVTSYSVGASSSVALTSGSSNDLLAALAVSDPGGVATLGAITPGSGYTPGVYNGVALTGGTGTGATGNVTVNGDGTVHAGGVVLVSPGSGYTAGDSLSAATATVGGTSTSPFSVLVATVGVSLPVSLSATPGVNGSTNVSFPVTKALPPGDERNYQTVSAPSTLSTVFTSWNDVMQKWPSPTGWGPLYTVGTKATREKQKVPASKGNAVRTAVYYNGTNWVYFDTGATLGGAVPPPELSNPYQQ